MVDWRLTSGDGRTVDSELLPCSRWVWGMAEVGGRPNRIGFGLDSRVPARRKKNSMLI